MKRFSPVLAVAFLALPVSLLTGCSADATTADEPVEQSDEALSACGAAKYDEAFTHYKNAVEWSKDRERNGVCGSEHGYQWGIADEASKAVMICGEFRNVIKSSVWAAPVRRVLGDSLTLRSLSGELAVIKDSKWQNWSGVETFFATPQGLKFWARAEGAYGSAVRIDFAAGGKATYGYLHYDAQTGDITWKTQPATYTITKNGSAAAKRTVTVVHGGKTEKFTLGVEDGWTYQSAPLFTLSPLGTSTTAPKLYSLVSECDA
jgi:hypothetical protein